MKLIGSVDLTGEDEVYDTLVNVRWLLPFTLQRATSHPHTCVLENICASVFFALVWSRSRTSYPGPWGGGPRVVVSTAAFHARVRGSVPGLGDLKETKMFLPHPRVKFSIVGSLRDREVACSASDRRGSNFESCVWRTVSSQSSHHPQEVLLAQFSLYVHKGGLKPDSFHFIFTLGLHAASCSLLHVGLFSTLNIPYHGYNLI